MAIRIDFDTVDEHGSLRIEESAVLRQDELARDEIGSDVAVETVIEADKGDLPGEYVVSGTLAASGELVCGRCLERFPFANDLEFAVRYLPRTAALEGGEEESEVEDGNLDLDYYDERILLLGEVLAEQVQLSIPMKTLCREGCKGLCPQCGVNLNEVDCGCNVSERDSRWQGLEELKQRLENEEKDGKK